MPVAGADAPRWWDTPPQVQKLGAEALGRDTDSADRRHSVRPSGSPHEPGGCLWRLSRRMTVDAAVTGACEVAESQTPVLGVAVPYAVANVLLTVLGLLIVGLTFAA